MNKSGLIWKGCVFFAASLLLASLFRLCFFFYFRQDSVSFQQFLPALALGARADAKWLALLLWPAWIAIFLAAAPKPGLSRFFRRACAGFAAAAALAFFTLEFINFFFYGFYGTPISSLVFGFLQDDTVAVLKTVLKDWPVFSLVLALAAICALPFLAARFLARAPAFPAGRGTAFFFAAFALGTVCMAVMTRGSLGTFPLRQQDYVVSSVKFINDTIPNGAAAFYDAWKSQKSLMIRSPSEGLASLGFRSPEEAAAALPARAAASPAAKPPRNIVLCVMEAMGRDMFEAHSPGNNTLGSLAGELPGAVAFMNGLSVQNGTFPTLEGILFDSPVTPVSQSKYGNRSFPFSKLLPFRRAGYRTVFLTAGPETWRDISDTFPLHGFDEVIGAAALKERYPEASYGTWGVSDEWMFRRAGELVRESGAKGEKLFLVMLSVTNHAPHVVPETYRPAPVSLRALPEFIARKSPESMELMLRTYQYACDSLGRFVRGLRESGALAGTVVAATGDHNMRWQYLSGQKWHHQYGVPILFWLPPEMKESLPRDFSASRWASHRDIFPTLKALALGGAPLPQEGRNLFGAPEPGIPAVTFTGPGKRGSAVSAEGAVAVGAGGALQCYGWSGDSLVARDRCGPELERQGNAARAQIGIADYTVRSSVLRK